MGFQNLNKRLNSADKKYLRKGSGKNKRRLLVFLILLIFALVVPSIFAYFGFKETLTHGKGVVAAYKSQQFDTLKKEVVSTRNGLQKANISLSFLFWLRAIPILGGYYSDAKGFVNAGVEELSALDKILASLEESKAQLGFDGNPKSGPERVTQALKLLNKSLPLLDKVEGNLDKAADSVKNINTEKYPEKFW